MKILILICACLLFGCADINKVVTEALKTESDKKQKEVVATNPVNVFVPKVNFYKPIRLSWENTDKPRPERVAWSDRMTVNIFTNQDVFFKALDTKRICKNFNKLSYNEKIKVLSEFFVALSFYESGYNPKASSVDVGTFKDKESYSVGLFQMSGNDSSAKKFNANFEKLKDPLVNIDVALEQFKKQITKEQLFILPNKSKMRYWAPILDQNKYQKIDQIILRVKNKTNLCN